MSDRPTHVLTHINRERSDERVIDLSSDLSWLPILGPSATVLIQVLIDALPQSGFDTAELAARCGIGVRQLWITIERLERFRVIHVAGTDVLVINQFMPCPSTIGRRGRIEV